MTISVIMPAHNAEGYIDVALWSLRDQDYADLDIVVVDDGSVDSTRTIALAHAEADSRVRVVALSTAFGRPSKARNAGIRAARGDYIAFLDADDVALPGRFSESMMAMDAAGATVVFADLERLYADERGAETPSVLRQRAFVERASNYLVPVTANVYRCAPDFMDFMVLEFEAVNIQTIVFDRRVLADGEARFDESLLCAEDLDLFYRIAQQGCIAFLDKVFTQYRIHSSSLTHSRPTQALLDAATVRLRYFIQRTPKLGRTLSLDVKRRLAAAFADAGYGLWTEGAHSAARSAILQSGRLHPTWRAGWAYCKSFIRHDSAVVAWVRRKLEA
jgi:glycosyltransferase involved in cell wall biosynthesis